MRRYLLLYHLERDFFLLTIVDCVWLFAKDTVYVLIRNNV